MSDGCPNPHKRPRTEPQERCAKIAVVGAGSWAQGWHLPHLSHNASAEIVAIVDPAVETWSKYNASMKPTQELGELYKAPVFSDIDSFLRSEAAGTTNGVIIASSHESHYSIAMKAIEAGLHILIEKPMTADVAEAKALAQAASASGKVFIVNNSANFREQAVRAHHLVKRGKLGDIEHVSCYMMREREFFDDPKNIAWVSPRGSMLGNGFAWGQLSHTLAWVYMVTGLSPSSVFCHMVHSKLTGADLYDSASIRCTNGATVSVQGVAGMPGANSVGTARKSGKLIENRIFGTEGCMMYSGDDADSSSGDLVLTRHDGENQRFAGFHFENTTQGGDGPESLQAFIDGCLGRSFFNAADAHVGLKVVQTIDLMYKSAKSGQVETIAA